MKFYDVRLMPDEEIKYSKEKEYSDFTTFLQSVIDFSVCCKIKEQQY